MLIWMKFFVDDVEPLTYALSPEYTGQINVTITLHSIYILLITFWTKIAKQSQFYYQKWNWYYRNIFKYQIDKPSFLNFQKWNQIGHNLSYWNPNVILKYIITRRRLTSSLSWAQPFFTTMPDNRVTWHILWSNVARAVVPIGNHLSYRCSYVSLMARQVHAPSP